MTFLLLSSVIDGQREESPETAEKIEALRDKLVRAHSISVCRDAVSENATTMN